jgi:hypothetical protein
MSKVSSLPPPDMSPQRAARKPDTRFKRGQSGNQALTRKAVELALGGDTTAMRLCFERILPARKDRPVAFAFPKIETAADAAKAGASLVAAVAAGELTPTEAGELSRLLENFTKVLLASEFEERLTRLEGKTNETHTR